MKQRATGVVFDTCNAVNRVVQVSFLHHTYLSHRHTLKVFIMRKIEPIEAALELIDYLEAKPNRSDLDNWMLQGFKLYRSGAVTTLDEGLGLAVGRGEARQRLPHIWRTRERNTLIRESAWHLRKDYPTAKQVAKLIAYAMQKDVPNIENRDARLLLIKLRNICIKPRAGQSVEIGERRVLEIINGEGH